MTHDTSPDPFDDAVRRELRDAIGEALLALRPRQADVLRLRFGLCGERQHTLEETGAILGISTERIRQIESQALRRLRNRPLAWKLREFNAPDGEAPRGLPLLRSLAARIPS